MTFNHATRAQFLARMRKRYQRASQVDALKIAAWLHANLTLGELRTVFGLTLAQAQALQTRLENKATMLATLRAQAGE